MAANTCPQSSDGNVGILLSKSDKYVLHSYVLALHSRRFKAIISERWQNGDSTLDHNGKQRWSYKLCFDKGTAFATLMKRGSSSDIISLDTEMAANSPLHDKSEIAYQHQAVIKAHQDLFGTPYHLSPASSHSSFQNAEQSTLQLSCTAEIYGCQHVVKLHIENHLRLYRIEVLNLCLEDPLGMLELALAVRSEWIFMEAATNLIGWDGERFDQAQEKLNQLDIKDLMARKRKDFVNKLRDCEFALVCIQPLDTRSSANVLAVNFFRQWLVNRLETEKSVARFLKTMGKGSRADEVKVELETVLSKAKDKMMDILNDITRRKVDKNDVSRDLTFIGVSDEELPWVKTS